SGRSSRLWAGGAIRQTGLPGAELGLPHVPAVPLRLPRSAGLPRTSVSCSGVPRSDLRPRVSLLPSVLGRRALLCAPQQRFLAADRSQLRLVNAFAAIGRRVLN